MRIEPRGADLVFLTGKVITVDPAFRIAEAVAVKWERIIAVGADAEIRPLVHAHMATKAVI